MPAAWEYVLLEDEKENFSAADVRVEDWHACTPGLLLQLQRHECTPQTLTVSGAVCGLYSVAVYKYIKQHTVDGVTTYFHPGKAKLLPICVRAVAEGCLLMSFSIASRDDADKWQGSVCRSLTGTHMFDIAFSPSMTLNQFDRACMERLMSLKLCTQQVMTRLVHLHDIPNTVRMKTLFDVCCTAEEAQTMYHDKQGSRKTKRARIQTDAA